MGKTLPNLCIKNMKSGHVHTHADMIHAHFSYSKLYEFHRFLPGLSKNLCFRLRSPAPKRATLGANKFCTFHCQKNRMFTVCLPLKHVYLI